jgi:uncharacterized protein
MTLTETERLVLVNQFRILEKLDATEADHHNRMAEILERGFTREYSLLADGFSKELSAATCEEVCDILDMHRALHHSYTDLEDKSGIDAADIAFDGFDGNNETEYLSYASFSHKPPELLARVQERRGWPEFPPLDPGPISANAAQVECVRRQA